MTKCYAQLLLLCGRSRLLFKSVPFDKHEIKDVHLPCRLLCVSWCLRIFLQIVVAGDGVCSVILSCPCSVPIQNPRLITLLHVLHVFPKLQLVPFSWQHCYVALCGLFVPSRWRHWSFKVLAATLPATLSHHSRLESSVVLLWEPQILQFACHKQDCR